MVRGLALTVGLTLAPALLHWSSCSASKGSDAEVQAAAAKAAAAEVPANLEKDARGLEHPKKATAWHTRHLVTTTPQPAAERITDCIEQVTTIAEEAGNQDDMLAAPELVRALAVKDPALYHFCFYQLAGRLDERLQVGGPLMSEVATVFFETMKALWIMARALDLAAATTGAPREERYFSYLRKRYVDLSREYFGREVEIVGPPLHSNLPKPRPDAAAEGKPAAAFQGD